MAISIIIIIFFITITNINYLQFDIINQPICQKFDFLISSNGSLF